MLPLSYSSPLAILVVDDEPAVLIVLESTLREDGHDIGTAASGTEALQLFNERKWNVVVTDRLMPGMDGEALAIALKHLAPSTPVVMVTGTPPRTKLAGVDAVVSKPFTRAKLAEAISRSLAACAPVGTCAAAP